MSPDINEMLRSGVNAAHLAGVEALRCMHITHTSIKNASELVTEADALCQKTIIDTLNKAFPEHGFIGEEGEGGKLFKQAPTDKNPVWWIIDPIDGTNNYANGLPEFSVSIGAFHCGAPVVGIVHQPSTHTTFTATRDDPARENGQILTVSNKPLNRFTSIGIDCHFGDSIPVWLSQIMLRSRFRNLGSTALHLAYVAKGGFAGMVVCTPKLWDLAAGILIARRAGAICTDWQGNADLPMNIEDYNGDCLPMVIAAPSVYQELMDLVQSSPPLTPTSQYLKKTIPYTVGDTEVIPVLPRQ
jgi:myo-inositol-1(or 4)-monophosphatase